ncbi:MAG: hypothetical protein WBK91_01745 [Alphaproteobacteria bacterium]
MSPDDKAYAVQTSSERAADRVMTAVYGVTSTLLLTNSYLYAARELPTHVVPYVPGALFAVAGVCGLVGCFRMARKTVAAPQAAALTEGVRARPNAPRRARSPAVVFDN